MNELIQWTEEGHGVCSECEAEFANFTTDETRAAVEQVHHDEKHAEPAPE
jgi:uncharacterized protein with PIN domain